MNFINGAELLEYCEKENKKISEAMFERETTFLEQDPEKTRAKMKKAWSIMQASAKKPLKENIVSMGGMIGGESRKLHTLRENKKNLCGDVVSRRSPMRWAFSRSTRPWDSSLRHRRLVLLV